MSKRKRLGCFIIMTMIKVFFKIAPNLRTSESWKSHFINWKSQRRPTKSEFRFWAGSDPACGVSEICDGENLWQWSRLEIRRKRLSLVNHTTKTIHHHHHQLLLEKEKNPKSTELCFVSFLLFMWKVLCASLVPVCS